MNIKNYHDKLSSKTRIKKNLAEEVFDTQKIDFRSTYYNVFKLSNFGKQLQQVAKKIQVGQECSFLFSSETHMMAINVKHKAKRAQAYYVIKFYDPSKTTAHKRIVCSNLASVGRINILDFLTKQEKEGYFSTCKSAILSSIKQREPGEQAIIKVQESQSLRIKLLFSLFYGWSELVTQYAQEIINLRNKDSKQKVRLLAARGKDSVPGLYFAMEEGHTDAIKAYTSIISNSDIGLKEKISLLKAKWTDFTGLGIAMNKGHMDTVKAFITTVVESNINVQEKKILLGPLLEGVSPKYENDTRKVVKVVIRSSKLSNKQQTELLQTLVSVVQQSPAHCIQKNTIHITTNNYFNQIPTPPFSYIPCLPPMPSMNPNGFSASSPYLPSGVDSRNMNSSKPSFEPARIHGGDNPALSPPRINTPMFPSHNGQSRLPGNASYLPNSVGFRNVKNSQLSFWPAARIHGGGHPASLPPRINTTMLPSHNGQNRFLGIVPYLPNKVDFRNVKNSQPSFWPVAPILGGSNQAFLSPGTNTPMLPAHNAQNRLPGRVINKKRHRNSSLFFSNNATNQQRLKKQKTKPPVEQYLVL